MAIEQQEEALSAHLFPSPAAASTMKGRDVTEVGGWLSHFLSALPAEADDADEPTPSRALLKAMATLSDGARVQLATKILIDCFDGSLAGGALRNVLMGHAATQRHRLTIRALAEQLHALADPAELADDATSIMERLVVSDLLEGLGAGGTGGGGIGGSGGDARGLGNGAGDLYDPRGSPPSAQMAARRAAELQARQASGNLSEEEKKELAKQQARMAAYEMDPAAAAAAEADELADRLAELQRRADAGELSDDEKREMQAGKSQLAGLQLEAAAGRAEAMAAVGVPADPSAADAEADALAARAAELKRKREAGELTDAERAELEAAEARIGVLGEAKASRDRVAELQHKKASGKLSKEEKAELAKEEKQLKELEAGKGKKGGKGKGGKGGDDDELDELRRRLAELERQHAKELADEQRRMNALLEKLMDPNLSDEERKALMAGEKQRQQAAEGERKSRGGGGGGDGDGGGGKCKKGKVGGDGGGGGRRRGGGGGGGAPFMNENGVEVADAGCQAGGAGGGGAGGGGAGGAGGGALGGDPNARSKSLPNSATTSLCEIRFNRKDVAAMNALMCRKVVAAMYMVKADVNAIETGKSRQGLPDFVPDQCACTGPALHALPLRLEWLHPSL